MPVLTLPKAACAHHPQKAKDASGWQTSAELVLPWVPAQTLSKQSSLARPPPPPRSSGALKSEEALPPHGPMTSESVFFVIIFSGTDFSILD